MGTNNIVTKENVTILDFERVCRSCLSTVGLQPISNLYNTEYSLAGIALNKYTQIQFHPLDKLPKQICSNCVKNLKNCYSFLLNCDVVNTSLKKCLARQENNSQTTEIEYVNCEIKQEPTEFDLSEVETKEHPVMPTQTEIENLHTSVDIKEDSLDTLEYVNDSDSCDEEQTSTTFEKESQYIKSGSSLENAAPYKKLPKKSQKRYDICYNQFISWQKTKNISSIFSENVLISYFEELVTKIKPSSLWTQYSMLRRTLNTHHDVNITCYLKLKALLKRNLDGYQPKKSKTLTPDEINKFLQEAPDNIYLLTKVALIFWINGTCGKGELCQLKIDDITDQRTAVLVNINDSKTKEKRSFTMTGEFYNIYIKYAVLRPSNIIDRRFFLHYQNGKCTRQPVGMNKFNCIPKQIATYLHLKTPELYTGHCFRRSSPTFADAGGGNTIFSVMEVENSPQ